MEKYKIRRAVTADMDEILRVYAFARQFMVANANPTQWGSGYPEEAMLARDIAEEKLYVVTEKNLIHGVFFFAVGNDATYAYIEDGAWGSDAPYGVIHRIAGDGAGGIFAAALAFCSSQIRHLRIDTHRDNLPMQHVLQKHGFRRCGIICVADGSARLAYERIG